MNLFQLLSRALLLPLVGAYLVAPDGTPAPGATEDCSEWVQASYLMTCAIIEEFFGMTEAQFESWNPISADLGSNCTLVSDLYYCVQVDYISLTTSSATPSSTSANSTTASSVAAISTDATTQITTSTTILSTSPTTTFKTVSTSSAGVTAPGPTQTGIISTCDLYAVATNGTGCYDFAANNNITLDELYLWNPAIGDCENFWTDEAYCVGVSS